MLSRCNASASGYYQLLANAGCDERPLNIATFKQKQRQAAPFTADCSKHPTWDAHITYGCCYIVVGSDGSQFSNKTCVSLLQSYIYSQDPQRSMWQLKLTGLCELCGTSSPAPLSS